MVNVTSVILGGGRGERLYPLTLERAKPAVSFAGKYRLIDIPISNCLNSGIDRIFVLTQFLSASLHRHIMRTYQLGPFTEGFVDILAAEQTPQRTDWFQGTADAVRATFKHTTYYRSDQMLILSGDHLYRMNYAELVRFHREAKADITICVYPVSSEEAPRMGLLRVRSGGEVEEFLEKPQDPATIDRFQAPPDLFAPGGLSSGTCLASMRIYVFEAKVLQAVLGRGDHADFGKQVIPSAIGEYRIVAYPFSDYWRDIGTIGALFQANLELARPDPPFSLYAARWPFYTRPRFLTPTRVIGSEIRDSLLADGSSVSGADIRDSVIGMRSIIRENAHLREVVMMGADFYEGERFLTTWEGQGKDFPPVGIGRECTIERAIIDKNARIGDGVVIRPKPDIQDFRSDTYWVRDGITVIPKGTVIPSGTVL